MGNARGESGRQVSLIVGYYANQNQQVSMRILSEVMRFQCTESVRADNDVSCVQKIDGRVLSNFFAKLFSFLEGFPSGRSPSRSFVPRCKLRSPGQSGRGLGLHPPLSVAETRGIGRFPG